MLIDEKLKKMKFINTYIIVLILVVIFLLTGLLMYKYSVEGELNMPFNLSKINIVSTAVSGENINKEDKRWTSELLQNNNIYFYIEKNNNYKKEDTIKKITFNNFIITSNENNDIRIFRPNKSNNLYNYEEEFIINQELEYIGAQKTDTEVLQINNQGGIIGFSVVNYNIAQYTIDNDEPVSLDGTLLKKLGINMEDIKLTISFDMIIETGTGNKFKSTISLDLPVDDITEQGIASKESTELKNVIFKRCK